MEEETTTPSHLVKTVPGDPRDRVPGETLENPHLFYSQVVSTSSEETGHDLM